MHHRTLRTAFALLAGLILPLLVTASASAEGAPKTGFFDFVFKDSDGKEHKYVIFVPHDYNPARTVTWPLILFLHGRGESEGGAKAPVEVGIGPAIKKMGEKEFPFFVLFPQCAKAPNNWSADGKDAERALKMLAEVQRTYQIDAKRIYLSGLSMGGGGTWSLAVKHPDKWAAIVPLCGRGDPKQADKIKHLPCWCFHGDQDQAVKVDQSREMIDALKAAGGKPKYDEYKGVGHNCWDRAYTTKELYDWLLMQRLK